MEAMDSGVIRFRYGFPLSIVEANGRFEVRDEEKRVLYWANTETMAKAWALGYLNLHDQTA